MRSILVLCLFMKIVFGRLWKNGIVHYSINSKDYDVHSQDIIMSTFSQIHKEICVKFFRAPLNNNATYDDNILYINNPEKLKTCSPIKYDYSKNIIDMPIGYKCLNQKDIAGIVVDMLKASINSGSFVNNYDIINKFAEQGSGPDTQLISSSDRSYINAHYHTECGQMSQPLQYIQRRTINDSDTIQMSGENLQYYRDKLCPLGVVFYGIDDDLKKSEDYKTLKDAMMAIEIRTCVVFKEFVVNDHIAAKNYLWFGGRGEDMPVYGCRGGRQEVKLSSFLRGAPGHGAHAINNFLRVLGVHMTSNRHDRDSHVIIDWDNVEKGKEQYLERAPEAAWIMSIPYDFGSVSHAPANYMCGGCDTGETTVHPIQDHLWQRTISMGHTNELSESDVRIINLLYKKQCNNRYTSQALL